jgi:hypothetical protein
VNNNGGGETAFRASNGAIDGTVKVGEDASKRRNASSKRDRAIKPPTTATKGGDDSVEVMSSSSGGGGPTLHGAQDLVVSSVGEGGGDGTGEGGRVSSSPPQQPQQKAVVDAGGLMVNVPPTPMPPESTWKPISFNVRKSLGQQQPQEEATRTTVSEVFAITDETTPAAAASMMMALHRSASPNEWLNFRIQPAGAHRTNPGVMQGSSRDLPIPPMDGSVKHSITSAGHNESLLNASGGRRKEILGESK